MHATMFARRALALPAVLTLALGGALMSSTSAQAIDGAVTITSPTADGAQLDTRYVTFEGSALDGSTIEVYQGNLDGALLGSTTATGGSWSLEHDYTDEDTDEQQIAVTGSDASGEAFDETVTRSFSMPAAAPVILESPATADVLTTRTATFTGSASPGSVVSFSDFDTLELLATADVGTDGRFTVEYTFADDADENQAILFEGSAWSGFDVRQFVLPIAAPTPTPTTLPAPVITSPSDGETVTGTEVTFEGTGTPGADIGLLVAPTGTVSTLADDPAARIIVDANGDWTVTLALQPAAYTAVAAQILLDAAGQPVLDGNGLPIASDDSTPVDFTLEAAAVAPFAAPVVTSPTAGQAVVGSTLTVTGTGTPGSNVAFVIYAQGGLPQSSGPFEEAQAESTIVVDAAGNWTSTVTGVRPGAYTIAPFAFDASGATTAVVFGDPVDFSVVAAVVTAAVPATPAGLAYTGSEGSETAAGIGAAALLAGALLLIAARRRAKLAVAESPAE